MSETKPNEHEAQSAPEFQVGSHEQPRAAETIKPQAETPAIDIEAARAKALSMPEQHLELPFDASPDGDQPQYIDRAMKRQSLSQELKLIRDKMTFSQRSLSRVVHQPLVRKTSDFSSKTITRPSGLLGGGIMAFCGSLVYLLFSKYIGMKYNYLLFLFLFVFGYIAAVIIEFLLKSLKASR